MGSRGRQSRGGDQIVARAAEQVQAPGRHPVSVVQHVHHRSGSTLLDTAAGFLLQGGDTAGFVAGAGVLINRLSVAKEIVPEAADHVRGLAEHLLIDTAVHEQAFGTEHLRHLREHRGAALGDEHIGEAAHHGVGRDAGKAVGAAAFHADHQFRRRDLLSVKTGGIAGAGFQQFPAFGKLVLHFLADQELHPIPVEVAQFRKELLPGQVLTAEAQDQHSTRVGMLRKGGQELSGTGMVRSGLGTAKGVRKGIEAVNSPTDQILALLHQGLCHIVDTAHGGDDPDLVADTHGAVTAAVSEVCSGLPLLESTALGSIGERRLSGKVRGHIMGMDPLAGRHRDRGMADRKAVFDHLLPRRKGDQGHLMSLGDVSQGRDAIEYRPCRDRTEGHRHIVIGMDADQLGHTDTSLFSGGSPHRCAHRFAMTHVIGRKQRPQGRPAPGSVSNFPPSRLQSRELLTGPCPTSAPGS